MTPFDRFKEAVKKIVAVKKADLPTTPKKPAKAKAAQS
jgi:hypothetical protein